MSVFRLVKPAAIAALIAGGGWALSAQSEPTPTNDAPNPYQTIEGHFKMPEGRTWGSTSAVDIARDGRSIWVAERCGANTCVADPPTGKMSPLDPVLLFDESGKLVRSFGAGMMAFPHGIHVDRDGNVWVTDGNSNAPQTGRGGRGAGAGAARGGAAGGGAAGGGAAGGGAAGAGAAGAAAGGAPAAGAAAGGQGGGRGPALTAPPPGATVGHQVFKFSPEGKLLLTIGVAGGATGPTQCCWQPNDVITNEKGEIFIAEGHGANQNDRIVVFSPDGKTILRQFGKRGTGPGEFNQPHALALDAQGRLFVGDRSNNRVQILDQSGKFIAEWAQFSRPSGLFIDRNGNLYSADSESGSVNPAHGAWKRGIRIGSVKDGKVVAFIPDPDTTSKTGTLAAEGVAVDAAGNIYGAEVGPRKLQKYIRKK
jgi:DNA-binding beta-propeller fold protein YncE